MALYLSVFDVDNTRQHMCSRAFACNHKLVGHDVHTQTILHTHGIMLHHISVIFNTVLLSIGILWAHTLPTISYGRHALDRAVHTQCITHRVAENHEIRKLSACINSA